MNRKILIITALLGAFTVSLGALGAHAFKELMSNSELANYKTAVFYQFMHIIAILMTTNFKQLSNKIKSIIAYLFLTGILFFSGSIYLISLHLVNAKSIWFITPLGGLLFISGWLVLGWGFTKANK